MYNRYIPQPDGSYQRKHVQDQAPRPAPPPKPERREPVCPQPCEAAPPEPQQTCPPPPCPRQRQNRQSPPQKPSNSSHKTEHAGNCGSPSAFLKNLLPRDFDTGDLLIVLLLLLMAGDQQQDQNTALLTLALYLFL